MHAGTLANAAAQLAIKVLLALPGSVNPSPNERIRVLVSADLPPSTQERISSEILAVCSFVSDLELRHDHIRFVCMDEADDEDQNVFASHSQGAAGDGATCRGLRATGVQVVVIGFNHGFEEEKKVDDLTLSELCQVSFSFPRVCVCVCVCACACVCVCVCVCVRVCVYARAVVESETAPLWTQP
jgi:hypothetical protein